MELHKIQSNQTQLMGWTWTKSTVLSNTDIVLRGRESEATPPALYIFSAGGQYKRTIPHVCKHEERINILAMNTQGQEYLCVSCRNDGCDKIFAINMKNDSVHVAYQWDGHYPAQMCTGPPGVMYVHCAGKSPILHLDCSRMPFTHTRTIESGMEYMYDMCFSSHPQPMLIFSDYGPTHVRAVSVDTSQPLWEIKGGDTIGNPLGVTPANNGCIILADGNKNKLVVLRSRDGKVLNTHHIENCGVAYHPHLINNDTQVVLYYHYQGKGYISLFKI